VAVFASAFRDLRRADDHARWDFAFSDIGAAVTVDTCPLPRRIDIEALADDLGGPSGTATYFECSEDRQINDPTFICAASEWRDRELEQVHSLHLPRGCRGLRRQPKATPVRSSHSDCNLFPVALPRGFLRIGASALSVARRFAAEHGARSPGAAPSEIRQVPLLKAA
jgi:hypothetical protein